MAPNAVIEHRLAIWEPIAVRTGLLAARYGLCGLWGVSLGLAPESAFMALGHGGRVLLPPGTRQQWPRGRRRQRREDRPHRIPLLDARTLPRGLFAARTDSQNEDLTCPSNRDNSNQSLQVTASQGTEVRIMDDIAASLIDLGADPTALRRFDSDGPELLPYATLVTARRNGNATLSAVEAVYEWQGAPLIFLVNASSLEDGRQLHRIRRLLAMRGDAPYVGVLAPGRLDVYSLALDKKSLPQAHVTRDEGDSAWLAAVTRLGNNRPLTTSSHRTWVSDIVLKLLTGSTDMLIEREVVSDEDAISLVGRALFTRFLADRNLLPSDMSDSATAASLFDTRDAAEKTSTWLDTTFNGDLLPLSKGVFEVLPSDAYHVLGHVLRRAPDGQLFLGWELNWANLDFAHIPVGVLSQAYELYLKQHSPKKQRREGGYYTPAPIANLMVRASVRALERQRSAKNIKILDPAAGGGVFLLTAFRELVAAHWVADGKRPDTKRLREILYDQIVGFDINEAALRFAALGLYLISIELDPRPRPVDKLRFGDLRGRVLHRVKSDTGEDGADLGSLGPAVGAEHVGQYDLVIGNPPWASGTKVANWGIVRATVDRIASQRKISNLSPPLPNEGLDLPFVWRAMEWTKPNGQIAFALHGRLLFQQGDGMAAARQALFEALDVTSIINGAEIRQTKVWPQISAPFCLLLATNRAPGVSGAFRFITPRIEDSLNSAGMMRIDAENAEVIPVGQLAETPDILKILFRGSRADLGVIERIRAQGHPTLEAFWRETVGVRRGGRLQGSGNGYQKLRSSSSVREGGDPLRGIDATDFRGIPEVTAATFTSVWIDSESLEPFGQERVHRSRSADLFKGPLVMVHKSPSARAGRIGVAVSDRSVIFNETFYGYSPAALIDAHVLVRYLTLLLGSKVMTWLALVTSGEFGFEREVIEKATIDRIPLPDFRQLSGSQRGEVVRLFERLRRDRAVWDEVDEWAVRLYGLGPRDLQVVVDTLEFGLPFAEHRAKAQAAPTSEETKAFCRTLASELRPWCERFGRAEPLVQIAGLGRWPWEGIEVRAAHNVSTDTIGASDWEGLVRVADEAAASEVLIRRGADRLLIGRLAQRRYWSGTQARLLAQRIVWSDIDLLKGWTGA